MSQIRKLNILDTPADIRLDRITLSAAYMLKVPISTISIVDLDRVWFKSKQSLDIDQMPRDISFCGHTIYELSKISSKNVVYEITNTTTDDRFKDNPLVIHGPRIYSYIGYGIKTDTDQLIGTLCAMSTEPKIFSEKDKQTLLLLGLMAENIILGRHHLFGI